LSKIIKNLVLAGLITFAANAQSADLKVGYVQVDKILQEAPQTAESGKKNLSVNSVLALKSWIVWLSKSKILRLFWIKMA
jgi:hypothetical protein